MLKNIRFLPAVEMTNLPNATFYDSISNNLLISPKKRIQDIHDPLFG